MGDFLRFLSAYNKSILGFKAKHRCIFQEERDKKGNCAKETASLRLLFQRIRPLDLMQALLSSAFFWKTLKKDDCDLSTAGSMA